MLPRLESFHLRWLEEPVIPDDTRGYKELKAYGRVPIAGGEPVSVDGYIDLDEDTPGFGLTVNEASLKQFKITE